MEEEPQRYIVTAASETWAPNLDILRVVQRTEFNSLVRANLQILVVIVMRGGFGVSHAGLGDSSRANTNELGERKGRGLVAITLFWGGREVLRPWGCLYPFLWWAVTMAVPQFFKMNSFVLKARPFCPSIL